VLVATVDLAADRGCAFLMMCVLCSLLPTLRGCVRSRAALQLEPPVRLRWNVASSETDSPRRAPREIGSEKEESHHVDGETQEDSDSSPATRLCQVRGLYTGRSTTSVHSLSISIASSFCRAQPERAVRSASVFLFQNASSSVTPVHSVSSFRLRRPVQRQSQSTPAPIR
jgi:hypothetical protein